MLPRIFLLVATGYYGVQILLILAIFAVAVGRIARGTDGAAKNEKVPMGEKVLAVKNTNGRKEVFK